MKLFFLAVAVIAAEEGAKALDACSGGLTKACGEVAHTKSCESCVDKVSVLGWLRKICTPDEIKAFCTPDGFICNIKDSKRICEPSKGGNVTRGGCEKECGAPAPAMEAYICRKSLNMCERHGNVTKPGLTKAECEKECVPPPPAGHYICRKSLKMCERSTTTKSNVTKAECEKQCGGVTGLGAAAGVSVPKRTLDTMTFMQAGTMQEADLTHSWVTSFSPPVPCESAAGTEGSAVYWDGLATINAVYKKFQLPGWYTELPDCGAMAGCKGIWERQKYPYKKSGMNPNWEANLAELIQALKPFVANGSITGVFLGDELVDQGVYVDNVSTVAKQLRAGLGSEVQLAINICARNCTLWPSGCLGNGWKPTTGPRFNPNDPSSYKGVLPKDIDLVSFDGYNWTNGTTEFVKHAEFLENQVFPHLLPNQRVLLCPGTFLCQSGTGGQMSRQQQEAQIVQKLRLMFEWAKQSPKVAGFIPWHLSNRKMASRPDCDYGLGAVSMPLVMAELKKIGSYTKGGR